MNGTTGFTWLLPPGFEGLGVLPVRLRSLRGNIVASGVSGRPIAVATGSYLLSITLPDGHEIIAAEPVEINGVDAPAGPDFDDELFACLPLSSAIPGAPASPAPALPAADTTPAVGPAPEDAPAQAPAAPPPAAAAPAPTVVTALRFQGDWGLIWTDEAAASVDFGADVAAGQITLGEQPVRVERGDQPDELIGFTVGTAKRLFVVPFDTPAPREGEERRSIFAQLKPNGTSLRFTSPVSAETNAYLTFVDQGLLAESSRIAHDLFDAFDTHRPSVLRAVAAGYVLLRVNELDRIEHCTDCLFSIAADVPDAHVIRAEAFARLGRHEDAILALHEGYTVGCPWFRAGVSHLLERLRFYLEVDAGPARFELGERRDPFRTWKLRLESMARRLDTTELFTTFTLEQTG